jgi:hypothetical protein
MLDEVLQALTPPAEPGLELANVLWQTAVVRSMAGDLMTVLSQLGQRGGNVRCVPTHDK